MLASTDEKTIMANDEGSNKRRRRMSPGILHITNLPDNVFADVAAYLPKPSRAMFSVAMTAPPSSWARFDRREQQQSEQSVANVILSMDQYDTLDLGDIDKALAKKLTDDDIASILACIDAANNLKSLKLTGCVSIVGRGLEPLRNSAVLKEIDLSLVKYHESPILEPEPSISEDVVVPILDSIIHAGSLAFLPLPKVWRNRRSPLMDRFLGDFNRLLRTRTHTCSECGRGLPVDIQYVDEITANHNRYYGSQNFSCHICKSYFCYSCEQGGVHFLNHCTNCERYYCKDCIPVEECGKCHADVCSVCETIKECQVCDLKFCCGCSPVSECACWNGTICDECAPRYYICEFMGCNKTTCSRCFDPGDGSDTDVDVCGDCERKYCSKCRILECSKDRWENNCSGCLIIISKMIPGRNERLCQENEELRKLQEKIEKLRNENKHLRVQNIPTQKR